MTRFLRTTPEYNDYIQSDAWNRIRKRVLRRDKHRCTQCGAKDRILHVHHKTYARLGRELLSDLVTLCEQCHTELHRRERKDKHQARIRASKKRRRSS